MLVARTVVLVVVRESCLRAPVHDLEDATKKQIDSEGCSVVSPLLVAGDSAISDKRRCAAFNGKHPVSGDRFGWSGTDFDSGSSTR